MEKEKEKRIKIFAIIFVSAILIIGIVFAISNSRKEEIRTSAQPENIQEEKAPINDWVNYDNNIYTGMSFNISKEEYDEKYLNNYAYEIGIGYADSSFNYTTTAYNDTAKIYTHQLYWNLPKKVFLVTNVTVDNNSNNVIGVRCAVDFYNINDTLQTTALENIKDTFIALDKEGNSDKIFKIFIDMLSNNVKHKFEAGICYRVFQSKIDASNWIFFEAEAMTEEFYNQKYSDITNNTDTTTEQVEDNKTTTQEGYNQQEEYIDNNTSTTQQNNTSSSNNNSSNNNSSSTGNKNNDYSSSTTQQSSQTSSSSSNNTNNTSSSNNNASDNNNETYQPKQITATLNIKMNDLINKNTTAQEIVKSENIYIRTEIKINGDTVDFDGKSYHSANEIPNTVTKKYNATLTQDNPVAKVTVIIQIYDNTAGTETTLCNKDITIDKTGTYEIK